MSEKKAVPQTYKNLWPLPVTTVLVSCVGKSGVPNIITIGACGIASARVLNRIRMKFLTAFSASLSHTTHLLIMPVLLKIFVCIPKTDKLGNLF